MANITLMGASYTDVPAVDLPQTGGGTVRFYESGGTPSATQHTILFEFEDTTTATITAYYDSTFISDAIRATVPATYDSKMVWQASLDGTAWYTKPSEDYETVWEGTSYVNAGTTTNTLWVEQMSNTPLTLGNEWRISIDGVSYICPVQNNGEDNYVGNPLYDGGADDGSGIPFIMYNYGWGAWNGSCATNITGNTLHTFKFERKTS